MAIEHPDAEKQWDDDREESEAQRLDRNWLGLLQELRVAQMGVQLLTGFLLILPFSDRFSDLDAVMRTVYLVTVACSIGATLLLIAPVAMHRILFRRRRLNAVVAAAHRYAIAGTLLLGLTLAGVATITFDAVAGRVPAWIAGGATLAALGTLWFAMPLRIRGTRPTSY